MSALRLAVMVAALTSSAAGAAPTTLAMLPISGEGLSTVELQDLDKIDLALRDALLLRDEITVQPREQTESSFKSTLAAGVRCRSNELECLAKVALLSEVALLVVPVARPGRDGKYEVDLALVNVETGRTDRATNLLPTSGKAVDVEARRLVNEVFGQRARPWAANVAARAEPPASAPPAPPDPQAPSTPPAPPDPQAPSTPPTVAAAAPAPPTPAASDDATVWWVAGGVGAAVVVTGLVVGAVALAGGANAFAPADPIVPPSSGPAVVELP